MTRAPLRFLLTILILWIGVRAAILLPGLPNEIEPVPEAAAEPLRTGSAPVPPLPVPTAMAIPSAPSFPVTGQKFRPEIARPGGDALTVLLAAGPRAPTPLLSVEPQAEAPAQIFTPQPPAFAPPGRVRASSSRWSVSAWLLVRDNDNAPSLVPGGVLGGSQAGARLSYALGGGLSLSGRFYLPLRRASGAELAAGIDWRPVASLPLSLLAERRQRLGRDGRNAFALTLYGGVSRNLAPRLRLDLYGQAGIVGLQSRDLFGDGSFRLSRRVGPVELGAGTWGAAQPGAARLDAGPSLSWRLPVPGANLRIQADWRFRIAGDAAPRSGPALTLATDF